MGSLMLGLPEVSLNRLVILLIQVSDIILTFIIALMGCTNIDIHLILPEILDLQGNILTGAIPDSLTNLASLGKCNN